MIKEEFELHVRKEPYYPGLELFVLSRDVKTGLASVAYDMTMKPLEEAEIVPSLIRIKDDTAQNLFNELWRYGFRPSDGTGSVGQLQATEKHLDDMRKIVSKKLDVQL